MAERVLSAPAEAGAALWPRRLLGLALLLLLLALMAGLHLSLGASSLEAGSLWQALVDYNPQDAGQNIIREIRQPRLVVALVVGAALAVAGVLMQAVSNNPLADPGLLGINSGAAFFVVGGLLMLPGSQHGWLPLYAFAGAAFAALLVLLLSGRQQSPERLVLAGVAVTALFAAMTAILLIVDQQGLDKLRHWLTGAIGASDLKKLAWVWPWLLAGLVLTALLARSLNAHHLGDRAAASLGVNVGLLKLASLALVIVLSGSVVAVAGPIGFVGLVVPHMARLLVRSDYRWLLPYALVLGAVLLVSADLAARIVVRPYEINTGIITALVGAPVFIALVIGRMR